MLKFGELMGRSRQTLVISHVPQTLLMSPDSVMPPESALSVASLPPHRTAQSGGSPSSAAISGRILPAASYNQDHEAVFRAGFTACRPHLPEVKPFQQLVLSCDNPAISWSLEREKFHPNFYVDITSYLAKKLEAVALHRSQLKPSVHHASPENIEYLARVRGREISVEAAEAFMCHRFVL